MCHRLRVSDEERIPGVHAAVSRTLAGVRYIRRDTVLLGLAVMSMIGNMRIAPLFLVIMPVYADRVFDSAVGLGVALAAFGATALVGALAYGAFAPRVPRRVWYLVVNAASVARLLSSGRSPWTRRRDHRDWADGDRKRRRTTILAPRFARNARQSSYGAASSVPTWR